MTPVARAKSAPSRQESHTTDCPDPTQIVSVLLASPNSADHRFFQSLFDHSNWKLFHCYTLDETINLLRETLIPVVVADEGQRDSWKKILDTTERLRPSPRLIVIPHCVDRQLWAEVLNLGGFDLLPRPWDGGELSRLLSHAWLAWKREKEAGCRQAARVAGSAA